MKKLFLFVSLILVALVVACSSQKKQERQEAQEQQAASANEIVFDPSGVWSVNNNVQLCLVETHYTGGKPETIITEPFRCNEIPLPPPETSKQIAISYNSESDTVDIHDQDQLRRITLDSETMAGIPEEPLITLQPVEVAPSCISVIRTFNGMLFNSSTAGIYSKANTIDYLANENQPEACKAYLTQLGSAIQEGNVQGPLLPFLVQMNALDLERIEQLSQISILYLHEATKKDL
jgi:hypothetical protein